MAENSLISWTDHTHNFWSGCTKIAPECANCYIRLSLARTKRPPFNGPILNKPNGNPERWNRKAAKSGTRPRVFTNSLSDFFHRGADDWRHAAWNTIRNTPNLDWLILTKRADRIARCLPGDWGDGWPNVWLGVTCGHDDSIHRVQELVKVPAKIRFVSAEPLLTPLNLSEFRPRLHWIIAGGESGPNRRPSEVEWFESLREQCHEYVPYVNRISFFMKQDTGPKAGQQGRIPDSLWNVKEVPGV